MPAYAPNRFRRRLTAAFVLVAAVSAGLVATATFVLARESRWRNFRSAGLQESSVALALAPQALDANSFDRLRAAYDGRSDAEMVVVGPAGVFTSSPALGIDDLPPSLRQVMAPDPVAVEASVRGRRTLVIGAQGRGGARYYFFFSLKQLEESLRELARVALAGWGLTVAAAGAVGRLVARATLRPIAEVAEAAEAMACGDLSARLAVAADDEFGDLARSFNHMADEVQALVTKLEQAATRQRRFTADVAHELRTPLTGMTATAAVLEESLDEIPAAVRRSATLLVSDVRRLSVLVAELLELSRLEAGTEQLRAEPLRVRDALEAVMRSAGIRHQADVSIEGGGDIVLLAEPAALRRILANLLDNAVVHGGGAVRVLARQEEGRVVIDMTDGGDGIPEPDLPHVFDRFYKSDESRTRGGSGLGLAIARQHALAQGGDLTASNVSGGGARFTLRLPAAEVAEETSTA